MNIQEREVKLAALKRPFPEEAIRERDGNDGNKYRYIPNLQVIERLDEVFPLSWDWIVVETKSHTYEFVKEVWKYNKESNRKEPTSKTVQGNVVSVHGRLILYFDDGGPPAVRDAFGGCETGKGGQAGDDFKIASSNALSKAAYSFGVGAHIGFEEQAAKFSKQGSNTRTFNSTYSSTPADKKAFGGPQSKNTNPFR